MKKYCVIKFPSKYLVNQNNHDLYKGLYKQISDFLIDAEVNTIIGGEIKDISIDLYNVNSDPEVVAETKVKILDLITSSKFYLSLNT